jgi:hypothetical protein
MCRGGKGRKLDCSEWNPRVELVGVEWSPYHRKHLATRSVLLLSAVITINCSFNL